MFDWERFLDLLQELLNKIGVDPTDPSHWKVSKDTVASGPVTKSTFGSAGIHLDFTDGGVKHTVEGKPQAGNHAQVLFDGKVDAGAHLAFTVKNQFPNKPLILVLEFVDVTAGGAKHRFRFDCPK